MIEGHISFSIQLNISLQGPSEGLNDADRSLQAVLRHWAVLTYGADAKIDMKVNAGKQNYMLRG